MCTICWNNFSWGECMLVLTSENEATVAWSLFRYVRVWKSSLWRQVEVIYHKFTISLTYTKQCNFCQTVFVSFNSLCMPLRPCRMEASNWTLISFRSLIIFFVLFNYISYYTNSLTNIPIGMDDIIINLDL